MARKQIHCVFGLACLLSLLPGCGSGLGSSEASRDAKYQAYARKHGELLLKEDYAGAYAMTSSHLKANMTAEQFAAAHRAARTKYGKPVSLDVDINATDPALLQGDELDTGFPERIPGDIRQARVIITFGLGQDATSGEAPSFDCFLNVVKEDGKDLICGFEYMWTD